jgi:hypothetical protein
MPSANQYQSLINSDLVTTIANSASLSGAIDLGGTSLAGYIMPASWTAASVTFQASVDGTNFYNLYDQFGNEITHAVAASRFIALTPSDLVGVRYIKLRSGTSASPVAQGAERQITYVTRVI